MNELTVSKVQVSNNRLKISFNCKGQIRKFFINNEFIAEYDASIKEVPEEILIIPFLATIAPIAWANNAEVFVKTVDATFLSSLNFVKATLQNFYPKMKFRGNIQAENIRSPVVKAPTRHMMLFSGGIDSIATFVIHQNENPILVSVQEKDFHEETTAQADNMGRMNISMKISSNHLEEFSSATKCENRIIVSNWIFLPDNFMLGIYQEELSGDWYTRVMHGLAFSGLCAPLTYIEKVSKLYIASSCTAEVKIPWGSHLNIDNNIKWTGTRVCHDGYELSRQEKLFFISNFIKNKEVALQVCPYTNKGIKKILNNNTGKNCNLCEKCSRTILGLELAGVDPNKHGFSLDEGTFSRIKKNLEDRTWGFGDGEVYMWADLQKHANKVDNLPHNEVRPLIEWLRSIDVESLRVEPGRSRGADFLFKLLPYPLFKLVKKIYIRLHDTILS